MHLVLHLRGGMQISVKTLTAPLRGAQEHSPWQSIDELDARVTKATKIRQDDLEEHTKQQEAGNAEVHCPTAMQITAQNTCVPETSRSYRVQVRSETRGVLEEGPTSRWCRRLLRAHRSKGIELHHAEEDLHKGASQRDRQD